MEKLLIDNINKSYDGKKQTLENISFSVMNGEFLSILGPSGCGKTTLLRILIGLEPQNSGSIYNDGIDISNFSPAKRNMGIVFQNYALFENMTVYKNVIYPLLKNGKSQQEAHDITMQTLDTVKLTNHIEKYPHELSGGQQQRVAFARTLALNPEIVLLDEPMSALDIDTRLALRSELKELQAKYKTTMIFITHDQEEAFALSDRILVMSKGKIEQLATPMELIKNPANEYVEQFVKHNINLKIQSLMPFAS